MINYEPTGKAALVVAAMKARAANPIWSAAEVAAVMEVKQSTVQAHMRNALAKNVIFSRVENGRLQFSLNPFPADHRIPVVDPNWKPPKMVATRPGSELPRGSLTSAPAPRPAAPAASPPATTAPAVMRTAPPTPSPSPPPAAPDTKVDDKDMVDLVEGDEEEGGQEFDFAIWRDGSLVIWGAQENVDGSITLLPEQLAEIKRRVAWSPL